MFVVLEVYVLAEAAYSAVRSCQLPSICSLSDTQFFWKVIAESTSVEASYFGATRVSSA